LAKSDNEIKATWYVVNWKERGKQLTGQIKGSGERG
jgi:hypothetical protein